MYANEGVEGKEREHKHSKKHSKVTKTLSDSQGYIKNLHHSQSFASQNWRLWSQEHRLSMKLSE